MRAFLEYIWSLFIFMAVAAVAFLTVAYLINVSAEVAMAILLVVTFIGFFHSSGGKNE